MAAIPSQVLLIRHCRSAGQQPDAPLTPEGTAAAAILAGVLRSLAVDALFSSPFRRARATLEPYAEAAGLAVTVDDRLAERTLAQPPSDDWVEQVRRSFDDPDHRAPGGESLREAQERGLAAVAAISQCGHRLPAIATHGNLLAGMLARADPSFGFSGWQALQNPDLFLGTCRDGDLVAFARVAPPR